MRKFFTSTQNLFHRNSGDFDVTMSSPISKEMKSRPFFRSQPLISDYEESKITGKSFKKRVTLKKKTSVVTMKVDDFSDRLRIYCADMFTQEYMKLLSQMYHLEDDWTELIGDDYMTAKMRKQQQAIWEFLTTERNYIRRMRVICEVFKQVFRIAQREGDMDEFKEKEIFGNINEILITNDKIWKEYFVQVIQKTRQKRRPIKPSELLAGFHETDELYKSYVEFNLNQDECLQKIREYSNSYNDYKKDDPKRNFKTYLEFCEELPQCERLKLVDLMTEPMQRMTRYPLLLNKIHDYTENIQEKKQLKSMITKFEGFVFEINKKKREIYEQQKLDDCLSEFERYNTWGAGNEDVIWVGVDFLRSKVLPNSNSSEPRCLLKSENMKLIEKKGKVKQETAVEVFLFTDCLVIARRKSSTKKLVILKQLFFLDKVRFIKSEVSNTSIVFLYLDEHGLLASSLMLELAEKSRDEWMNVAEKAKERYDKARSGRGSTLEFFQDDNKFATDDPVDSDEVKNPEIISTTVPNGGTEIFRKPTSVSYRNNKNLNRIKRSTTNRSRGGSIQEEPTDLHSPFEEEDFFYDDTTTDSANRKSASWLLTEEKRVQSIRTLLREDLWGGYVNVKPHHTSSFRSEASDSGISLSGDSFKSTKSNNRSPVSSFRSNPDCKNDSPKFNRNCKTRKFSTCSVNLPTQIDHHEQRCNIVRKFSSTSSVGLPNISEHIYTELNFLRRDEIKNSRQRRSLKHDDASTSTDENNNEHMDKIPNGNMFGSLKRSSNDKELKQLHATQLESQDQNADQLFNGDVVNYKKIGSSNRVCGKEDKQCQCNLKPLRANIGVQTVKPELLNYVNFEVIAKYGNYLEDE